MKFPYNKVLKIQSEYKAKKISLEEAKEQLAYLLDLSDDSCEEAKPYKGTKSYGPLLRLSDLCNILRIWASVRSESDHEFYNDWSYINIAIEKSNLLYRLFFTPEGIRKVPCPHHKGRWSGCFSEGTSGPCDCQAYGNVTGWLPEENDQKDLDSWNETYKKL